MVTSVGSLRAGALIGRHSTLSFHVHSNFTRKSVVLFLLQRLQLAMPLLLRRMEGTLIERLFSKGRFLSGNLSQLRRGPILSCNIQSFESSVLVTSSTASFHFRLYLNFL